MAALLVLVQEEILTPCRVIDDEHGYYREGEKNEERQRWL